MGADYILKTDFGSIIIDEKELAQKLAADDEAWSLAMRLYTEKSPVLVHGGHLPEKPISEEELHVIHMAEDLYYDNQAAKTYSELVSRHKDVSAKRRIEAGGTFIGGVNRAKVAWR